MSDDRPASGSPRFLLADFLWSAGAAAVAAAAWYRFPASFDCFLQRGGSPLYTTVAQIAAGLLGFIITGVSIALVVVQDAKFTAFRRSKHHKTLWLVFRASTWPMAVTAMLGIIGIFVYEQPWLFFMTAFFFVLSAMRLLHIIRTIFLMIAALVAAEDRINEENERLRRDAE